MLRGAMFRKLMFLNLSMGLLDLQLGDVPSKPRFIAYDIALAFCYRIFFPRYLVLRN